MLTSILTVMYKSCFSFVYSHLSHLTGVKQAHQNTPYQKTDRLQLVTIIFYIFSICVHVFPSKYFFSLFYIIFFFLFFQHLQFFSYLFTPGIPVHYLFYFVLLLVSSLQRFICYSIIHFSSLFTLYFSTCTCLLCTCLPCTSLFVPLFTLYLSTRTSVYLVPLYLYLCLPCTSLLVPLFTLYLSTCTSVYLVPLYLYFCLPCTSLLVPLFTLYLSTRTYVYLVPLYLYLCLPCTSLPVPVFIVSYRLITRRVSSISW
ncbi:hypothetical protein OTU49_017265 [Cherax quadricarinatus]|uniref:Uncharacterized protein n=1 Tax=Cherax quadricarinatus TaxID=27406 RepID=A0AAW0Y2M5_CHEQU